MVGQLRTQAFFINHAQPCGERDHGDPQGTTSISAVPDTGSAAALLGVGVVALAFTRRRLG
ncbi:VPDSG-CTERM sorting domain-containing protein [Candidatus Pelagisphaera phototrophica]|uniref:VPDSG-CTERM sorting domain-containing protein n=1 Tax=Candidatus Pelagisphaera phototrophica TaxID=2684113 RepID=UPI0019F71BD2|nr:VPDSG-CTERM sorting domain-containing protein [Candidatus Pelagisphaera phototrophica]